MHVFEKLIIAALRQWREYRLNRLIKRARHVILSPADREAQRRSFAYGNLKIDRPDVTREDIDRAAERLVRRKAT